MPRYYEKAIYLELGEDIGKELKANHCEIIINYEDVTYNFSHCPDSLLKKIIKVKKSRGTGSILNEFHPVRIAAHLKWNMSNKDRKCLINKFHNFETTLDRLIFKQKITCEKLRKNLEIVAWQRNNPQSILIVASWSELIAIIHPIHSILQISGIRV